MFIRKTNNAGQNISKQRMRVRITNKPNLYCVGLSNIVCEDRQKKKHAWNKNKNGVLICANKLHRIKQS